jgi:hypothetical protein
MPTPPEQSGILGADVLSGDLAPHASSCAIEFTPAIEGSVTASVIPSSLDLELHTGGCSGSGSLVAATSTGSLVVPLRAGQYHAQVGNPTDVTVHFSARVEYLH